ncbi:MAG: hypothetical protein CVV23_01815 [Ignavibacteriae bacterium HGW-Ignavibacteriae-2]|jgi:hypothetical protein|nr:MAG: hypothetical protein CVV23_01815 [Ignavibacteriae bacterium HGW-Ignavibacteriae-2]
MPKEFEKEIEKLDEVYSEMVEAIMNKPESQDYEISRIYFENVAARLNNWVAVVKEVKYELEKRQPLGDLSADNRPA